MANRLLDRGVRGRALVALACVAAGAGCAVEPPPPTMAPAAAQAASGPAREGGRVNGVPAAVLEAALDDATRRSSVARNAIRVVSAESVTWPDGALGCPQPGMLYTQALVPGYRIVLQAGTGEMHYPAGRDGRPRFCPAANARPPASTETDMTR